MKERDYQLDNIRGILVFFVVFGHALELVRINSGLSAYVYNFIYMFHMPVYIFITGYLSKNISKGRDTAFRKLFIPFLLFNSIWNFIQVVSMRFIEIPLDNPVAFSFLNPGWALWFILALFLWKLLLPDLLKIKNIFAVVLVIGLFSRLFSEFNIFLSLSRFLVFSPYFIGGYLFNRAGLDRIRKVPYLGAGLIILLTLVFNYFFTFYTNYPTEFLWADRSFSFFSENIFISIFFGAIIYLIGFAFVAVFIKFTPHKQSFISKLGKHSLPVYILHTYVIGVVSFMLLDLNDNLQLLLLAGISALLAYLLSQDIVFKQFNKLLDKVDRFLFKVK